jgi:hypothetical protein
MTEYRIGERDRRFWIEVKSNKVWVSLNQTGVPRYFDSLADARSWVATIKRGVVYHDAEDAPKVRTLSSIFEDVDMELAVWMEMDNDMQSSNVPTSEISGLLARWHNRYTITRKDAPNLAQDERKAEDYTSDGIKPLEWFEARIDDTIIQMETIKNTAWISDYSVAKAFHRFQTERGYRYKDQ